MVITSGNCMVPSTGTLCVTDPTGTDVFSSAYAVTVTATSPGRVAVPRTTSLASTVPPEAS